jgi:hypothetical protein
MLKIWIYDPGEWRYAKKDDMTFKKHRGPLVRLNYFKAAMARSTAESVRRHQGRRNSPNYDMNSGTFSFVTPVSTSPLFSARHDNILF